MSPLRLAAAFLSVMVLALSPQAMAQDFSKSPEMTLKLGHMSPGTEENPYHLLALYLEKHLPEKTGGKLKIQIFHSGQLGRDRELLEAIQFGTLDLAVITTSPMTNFVPAYTVLDYPFIFRDWDHVEKVMAAPWMEEFKAESQRAKFHTLAFVPRGFRSVTNSKVKIYKPDDMKGLKLRVIESPIFVDTFNALGASAQAMSWGEVFTALQQGTIDGHENALNTIFDERVYEVQKYVSLTQHIFAYAAFVASPPLFSTNCLKSIRTSSNRPPLRV